MKKDSASEPQASFKDSRKKEYESSCVDVDERKKYQARFEFVFVS